MSLNESFNITTSRHATDNDALAIKIVPRRGYKMMRLKSGLLNSADIQEEWEEIDGQVVILVEAGKETQELLEEIGQSPVPDFLASEIQKAYGDGGVSLPNTTTDNIAKWTGEG